MDEKGTMTFSFDPTPELRDLLGLRDREYVVKNPVEIVVETQDGGRLTPPQEVREHIVRCRDCRRSFEERGELWCRGIVGPPVEPDGFCAWGERGD